MTLEEAANRLHHLSMRYVGAFAEMASGEPVTFLPIGTPGLKEMRDIIDIVLLVRAELNALTQILISKRVFTQEEWGKEVLENYDWLTQQKAKQLGVEVSDVGLVIKAPDPKATPGWGN